MPRVLVGYATRTDTTKEVAERVGEVLSERGFEVSVQPLNANPSPAGFDAAVIGSAVNGGNWLPEALTFVNTNAAQLSAMPVTAFCVHIMNAGADSKATAKRLAYLDPVRDRISLRDEAYFLGKGPTAAEASRIARWAFRAFGGSGEGDCRDWDAIDAWAKRIAVPA